MNKVCRAVTLEKAWLKALQEVHAHGELVPDSERFHEISNLVISYDNAFEDSASLYIRFFGTDSLEYIKRVYSKEGEAKTGRNYYKLIHEMDGEDQVAKVLDILKKEPLARSATIILASTKKAKLPCVTEINFSIRKGLLHMAVLFKSSDLAKKFIPDMLEISKIHKEISRALKISRGRVTAHILCAQIYEQDMEVVRTILKTRVTTHHYETDRIIKNWDDEAATWDEVIKRPEHYVNIEDGYNRFLRFLESEIPPAGKKKQWALDSGCGTGIIAVKLKEKGYQVHGVDISPEMLRYAHKDSSVIRYILANSLDMPYPDEIFGVVCSRGVLASHVGKKYVGGFIQEHHRVLKKGGLFMFDFITHFQPNEAKKKRKKAFMKYEQLAKLLESNGFRVLERSGDDTNRVNAIVCKKV